ncbi:MAG TPA: hypothetical protein VFQ36_25235 [Ktedonobacteraceae bacterium]|nr:hypothetical protein [Ktedonobacteraceae bacterium]
MQQHDFPTIQIGFDDLSVLRNVIRGYLAYSRRTTKPTPERQEQARLLDGIYQRLLAKPNSAAEVHIHLQLPEIHALNTAMLGFCAFVRQKVPPSRDRDETLQDLEGFRQMLPTMLPA